MRFRLYVVAWLGLSIACGGHTSPVAPPLFAGIDDTPRISGDLPSSIGTSSASVPDFGTPTASATIVGVSWLSQYAACPTVADSATCGPTAAAMGMAYVSRKQPADVVKAIVDLTSGHWPCGRATSLTQLSEALTDLGIQNSYQQFDASSLLHALQNKQPVIAHVFTQKSGESEIGQINFVGGPDGPYGHYMLVVGLEVGTSLSVIVAHDPGRSVVNQKWAENRRFPLDQFVKAWTMKDHNMYGVAVVGPVLGTLR